MVSYRHFVSVAIVASIFSLLFLFFANYSICQSKEIENMRYSFENKRLQSLYEEEKKLVKQLTELNELYEERLEKLRNEREGNKIIVEKVTNDKSTSPKEEMLKEKLKEYTQLHGEIMKNERPQRFVRCILINGWGNVFQEAVSCLLYALISKRAIIFDTGALDSYMPFKKYLLLPFDGYNKPFIVKYFPTEKQIDREEFACLDLENDYKDETLITIKVTYDWFASNMLINPLNQGEFSIEKMPFNYFQILFNYLFTLNIELESIVEQFVEKHFSEYTIGIQIRHPTLTKKGEKDHKGFPVPPIDLYAEVAEQMSRFQEVVPYQQVKWFIATQNIELIQYLRNAYGNKIISYNGTIATTFENDFEGQKSALATWWLLSLTNDVITTEASSYGTTAAAKAGHYPIVCNHHKFCFRRMTPTPCQDTPWLREQPLKCFERLKKFPHQFLLSPFESCGHYKLLIYESKEYQSENNKK